jgi:hypothetical protein
MVDFNMLSMAVEAIAVIAGHALGETIFHFARRNQNGIRLKGPFGQIDVTGKEDPARIAEFLRNLAEIFHGRSDK